MIGDHYLHILRWVPNFVVEEAKINKLLVWVRFFVLSVEYYMKIWLKRAGNQIRKTLRIDDTTIMASRGKFA